MTKFETKHTPGQWEYVCEDNPDIPTQVRHIVRSNDKCIAFVCAAGGRKNEAIANAQLIACAPAMLEVLMEIMDGKSGCDDEWSLVNIGIDDEEAEGKMYERIRELIAKAKGLTDDKAGR